MSHSSLATPATDWQSFETLQSAIDACADPVFVKDSAHRFVAFNTAFCSLLGHSRDDLLGRSDPDFVPTEQANAFWLIDDEVFASNKSHYSEEVITNASGVPQTIWTRKFPIRNDAGEPIAVCGVITDITPIKQRQLEVDRLQNELQQQMQVIETQRILLDEVSVPVIQLWSGILLIPLIGAIESRRAMHIMESMLEAVGREGAQYIIIDITGVPVVDTNVAGYLIRTVQAAQLLGCQSILVGISPEIAQTLVGLSIDFGNVTTRATLQNGLEYAFQRLRSHAPRPN